MFYPFRVLLVLIEASLMLISEGSGECAQLWQIEKFCLVGWDHKFEHYVVVPVHIHQVGYVKLLHETMDSLLVEDISVRESLTEAQDTP